MGLLAPLLLPHTPKNVTPGIDRKKEEKTVNAVDVKDLKKSLCALWDIILQAQDEIATIIDTLGWPKSEEQGLNRAWLFRPGEAPVEITLAEYYAAAKEVNCDPGE